MTDLFDFDYSAADAAKAEAMERVDVSASELWKRRMHECIRLVAIMYWRFTSDHVYELAVDLGWWDGTHEKRALGPRMQEAAKAGFCKPADCAPVKSCRASLHGSPRRVWESLLYRRPDAQRGPLDELDDEEVVL